MGYLEDSCINTVALLTHSEVGVLIYFKKALITLLMKYNSGDGMSNLTAQLIYEENKLLIYIKFLNENYYCFFTTAENHEKEILLVH